MIVCSSPAPSCSISSTCESGSRRAPKRDFVFRTPFAIAPIRPRSAVYRWRMRSASENRIERRTTASVLYVLPAMSAQSRAAIGESRTAPSAL